MKILQFFLIISVISPMTAFAEEKTKTINTFLQDSKRNSFEFSIGEGYFSGNLYAGGEAVPAQFANYNFRFLRESSDKFHWGLKLGILRNQSASQTTYLNLTAGYHKSFNKKIKLLISPEIGIGYYDEKTEIQHARALGLVFGLDVGLRYDFNQKFFGSLGIYWTHPTFASSFWGEDPWKDIVIDQVGPYFSLGYSW